MKIKIWCLIAGLLMLAVPETMASEISEFRISQIRQILPNMRAFLHIEDAEGNRVHDLNEAAITAFIGGDPLPVSVPRVFNVTDEGMAIVFLVDLSKSMRPAQFATIKDALLSWVDAMTETDRAAVMTLGTTVRLVQDFTDEKDTLRDAVQGLGLTDMDTQLHRGLVKAMELGRRKDEDLPDRRAVITLSDGQDDFIGGMTEGEVFERIKENPVPIYAIGFVRPPMTREKEAYLKLFGKFARASGGQYFTAGDTPMADIYTAVRSSVGNVWVADLDCSSCLTDGGLYRLQMNLTIGGQTLTDGMYIRLLPEAAPALMEPLLEGNGELPADTHVDEPAETEPETIVEPSSELTTAPVAPPTPLPEHFWEKISFWNYASGTLIVLLLVLLLIYRRKWIRPEAPTEKQMPAKPEQSSTVPAENEIPKNREASQPKSVKALQIRLSLIGKGKPQEYEREITQSLYIGRDQGSDVVIKEDDEISGQHCELQLKDESLYIRDLGSTNGTMINGVALTGMYRLQNNDTILVGRTELRISF